MTFFIKSIKLSVIMLIIVSIFAFMTPYISASETTDDNEISFNEMDQSEYALSDATIPRVRISDSLYTVKKGDKITYTKYLNVNKATKNAQKPGYICNIDGKILFDTEYFKLINYDDDAEDLSSLFPVFGAASPVTNLINHVGVQYNCTNVGGQLKFNSDSSVLFKAEFEVIKSFQGQKEISSNLTTMSYLNKNDDQIKIYDSYVRMLQTDEDEISEQIKYIRNISECSISSPKNTTYTGTSQEPAISVKYDDLTLRKGTDYTISYQNNKNAGTATITVTGINDYTGSKKLNFNIAVKNLNACKNDTISTLTYTALAQTPLPVIKDGSQTLKKDTDYTLTYSNNKNAGTGTVTAKGIGNYGGTLSIPFSINQKDLSSCSSDKISNAVYDSSAKTPEPVIKNGTVTLKKGTDYSLSYSNNKNAGTGTVTAKGIGNYSGTLNIPFKIDKKSISSCTSGKIADLVYDSTAKTPEPIIKNGALTLKKGTDYTLSYSNNKNAGTGTVTVKGIGNYNGDFDLSFKINALDIASCSADSIKDLTYNTNTQTPDPVIKYGSQVLKKGSDYTLAYSNNKNAGTASVLISGKGNFKGTLKKDFKIQTLDISSYTITVQNVRCSSIDELKENDLRPTLSLKKGDISLSDNDYSISIKNGNSLGTATVTLSGRNNCTGNKSAVYKILLKGDFDNDKEITVADASTAQLYLANIIMDNEKEKDAYISDSSLNITEATKIQMYLAHMIGSL